MSTTTASGAIDAPVPTTLKSVASARLAFMDNLRYLMVVLVIVYHAVAAYALNAPHWVIHDTSMLAADIVRELFDVFMMPIILVHFFIVVALQMALTGWVGGLASIKVAIVFLAGPLTVEEIKAEAEKSPFASSVPPGPGGRQMRHRRQAACLPGDLAELIQAGSEAVEIHGSR
jgi:hypothetical protein